MDVLEKSFIIAMSTFMNNDEVNSKDCSWDGTTEIITAHGNNHDCLSVYISNAKLVIL